jgi:hypothetical protein
MRSPVENRLREALAEAGATIDPGVLRPLQAPERRRFRVDFRLVAVAAAVVVLAGAATAVGLRGHEGGEDRAVATNPEPAGAGEADMAVFLCTASAPAAQCRGKSASPEETKAIASKISELPQVEEVFFVDQAEAYERFRAEFAGNKTILTSVKVTDLPPSFKLNLKEGADQSEASEELLEMPGVLALQDLTVAPTEGADDPVLSVFLCGEEPESPACGAEVESDGKRIPETVKVGKAITNAQKDSLRKLIEAMPEVASFVFEDRKTAYENFRLANKFQSKLLQQIKAEDMPESFRLVLKPGADRAKVTRELRRQPGVRSIAYNGCPVMRQALSAYGLLLPDSDVCPAGE